MLKNINTAKLVGFILTKFIILQRVFHSIKLRLRFWSISLGKEVDFFCALTFLLLSYSL